MRNRRIPRDPHWINTKYATTLPDGEIKPAGSRAFYFPSSRTLLFGEEAERAAARFQSELADEELYRAGYGV